MCLQAGKVRFGGVVPCRLPDERILPDPETFSAVCSDAGEKSLSAKYAFCSSHHYIIPHPRAGDNTLSNKTFGHKTKITLPLPSVLFYILLFLYDRSVLTAITFACAGAHELGHMAAARLCGVGITGMTLYPFGADIRLDSPLRSYRKDFFISSAGIAVNLALAAISRAIPAGEVGRALIYVNLTLAAANIVPIDGLDGGGMLRAGMSLVFSPVAAARVLRFTSFAGLLIMWGASVYIFFVKNGNPSLFVISCTLFACLYLKPAPR